MSLTSRMNELSHTNELNDSEKASEIKQNITQSMLELSKSLLDNIQQKGSQGYDVKDLKDLMGVLQALDMKEQQESKGAVNTATPAAPQAMDDYFRKDLGITSKDSNIIDINKFKKLDENTINSMINNQGVLLNEQNNKANEQ